jgi:hypothetical protein
MNKITQTQGKKIEIHCYNNIYIKIFIFSENLKLESEDSLIYLYFYFYENILMMIISYGTKHSYDRHQDLLSSSSKRSIFHHHH